MGVSIVACSPKSAVESGDATVASSDGTTIKDLTPSKAQLDSVSYLVGINFGSFIKGYDFGDLNYSEIVKGIKDCVAA